MSLETLEIGDGKPQDFDPTDVHHKYLEYVEEVKARWAQSAIVVQPPKGINRWGRLWVGILEITKHH